MSLWRENIFLDDEKVENKLKLKFEITKEDPPFWTAVAGTDC